MKNQHDTDQQEIQRKLGHCIIRLQRYERLLKAVIADADIDVAMQHPASQPTIRQANHHASTLGTLVKAFVKDVLAEEQEDGAEDMAGPEVNVRMRMKMKMIMSCEARERMTASLRELVSLRNGLVHHFIEQFDLSCEDGCRAAFAYLEKSLVCIDEHGRQLHGMATAMAMAQKETASFLQSQEAEDIFLHGVYLDRRP